MSNRTEENKKATKGESADEKATKSKTGEVQRQSATERARGQRQGATQPASNQTSMNSDEAPRWIVLVSSLFFLSGIGVGLFWILLDELNPELFDVSETPDLVPDATVALALQLRSLEILIPIVIAISVAPFVGAALVFVIDARFTRISGIGCSVGTGAMAVFATVLYDSATSVTGETGTSINFGDVFTIALVAGLVAGMIGIAGAQLIIRMKPN